MECCEPAQWQLLTAWAARQGGREREGRERGACCGIARTGPSTRNQRTLICTKTINNAAAAEERQAGGGQGQRAGRRGRTKHSIAGSWCERRYKRQSYKKQPPKQPTQLPSLPISFSLSLSLSRCLYRHLCLAARAEPN